MTAATLPAVVVLAAGCTADDDRADGADAVELELVDAIDRLGCEEETSRDFTATFGCTVSGEPVALHEVSGSHEERLRKLSTRYPIDGVLFGCPDQPASRGMPTDIVVVDGPDWIAVAGSPDAAARLIGEIGGTIEPSLDGSSGPPISYDASRFWDCDD